MRGNVLIDWAFQMWTYRDILLIFVGSWISFI